MASYEERRQAGLERLRQLTMARQKYDLYMYQKAEEEQRKYDEAERQRKADEAAAVADKERSDKLNWFDDASQGAMLGAGVGGPIGALVGAIGGTLKGQYEAYGQRRDEGAGKWNAFHSTIGDTPFGFNLGKGTTGALTGENRFGDFSGDTSDPYMNKQFMMNMAQAYGSAKAKYDQDQARKSTAQMNDPYGANQRRASRSSAGTTIQVARPGAGDLEQAYAYQPQTVATMDDPQARSDQLDFLISTGRYNK